MRQSVIGGEMFNKRCAGCAAWNPRSASACKYCGHTFSSASSKVGIGAEFVVSRVLRPILLDPRKVCAGVGVFSTGTGMYVALNAFENMHGGYAKWGSGTYMESRPGMEQAAAENVGLMLIAFGLTSLLLCMWTFLRQSKLTVPKGSTCID